MDKMENGVILMKIYLLKRQQVEHLIHLETGANSDLERAIEKKEKDYKYSIDGSKSIYDCFVRVGELDNLPIFSLSRKEIKVTETVCPSLPLV